MKLPSVTPLRIAVAVGISFAVLRLTGCQPLHLADLRALDFRFLQRGPEEPAPEVVIVAVDNASIESLGRWPWPRARVASLIDHISAAGALAIGVDFVQSESGTPEDDSQLAAALESSKRTVLGYFFDFERRGFESPYAGEAVYSLAEGAAGEPGIPRAAATTQNLPELRPKAAGLGYFNFLPDDDGLLRRAPLAVAFAGRVALPLSLATLQRAWPGRPAAIRFGDVGIIERGVKTLRIGSFELPVEEDGQLLLNFRGPGRTFPHVPAVDLLADRVPPEMLRGKLALLGVTATAVADVRATPFDPVYPGIELHATVLDNVLRNDFLHRPKWAGSANLGLGDAAATLALTVGLGLLLQSGRGLIGALIPVGMLGLYLFGSQLLFTNSGTVLSAAYPVLALTLAYIIVSVHHYLTVEREKRETRRVLELYLSPSVAGYLSERPEMLKLGGEKRDRSVLFSDLRNSTTIAERLEPEQFVELLNSYLGDMTEIVFANDGMLDKYIGDGVMAVWGAPLPQANHAARACRAALSMVDRLSSINTRCAQRGWPSLAVRIGLNSGPMIFGNMGSAGHLSLTVMGDSVNLGARLEGLNKLYGTTIIANESTIAAAGEEVVARELDVVRVKGKLETARIFELLGPASSRTRWQALIEHFQAGLTAYRARDWGAALQDFERIMRQYPEDGPAELYIRRCQQLLREPPPKSWEPVTTFGET